MESVLSEYEASLADLTFNSKPHINMLTVLAEENVSFASDIVKIIETRLFEVWGPMYSTNGFQVDWKCSLHT